MNEQSDLGSVERSVEAFVARVRAQETAPADLWVGVQSRMDDAEPSPVAVVRSNGRAGVRRMMWAAAIATVVAFAALLVSIGRGGQSQPVVNAEELLRRAVVTNAAPEAMGIARLALTVEGESFALGDWARDEPSFESLVSSWYEAPDRQRVEGDYLWRGLDGATDAISSIDVWDGTAVWRSHLDGQQVFVQRQDPEGDIFLQGALAGGSLFDVPYALAEGCRTPRLVDHGEVVGRASYVLELSRPRCGLTFPGRDGRQLIWVDQVTELVLRSEWYTADDRLAAVRRVTKIEVDGEIDSGRFELVIPSGVAVDDRRDESSFPYLQGFSRPEEPPLISINEARELATFALQVPATVPDGFELESVQQYWGGEMARELRSHADWVLLRYVDRQGNWLQIVQGYGGALAGLMMAAPPDAAQGTVSVGGVDVHWVDGSPAVQGWEPGSMLMLSWEVSRDGVAREYRADGDVRVGSPRSTSLATNVLTLDELVAVAESLE